MIAELRTTNAEFADFLNTQTSVPILQIDNQQLITDCNKGFLGLFSLSKKPVGAFLSDFLLPGIKDVIFTTGVQEFVCNPRTGVHGILMTHRIQHNGSMLLWCERPFSTNNQVVEQMSVINNEIIAIQRELTKKNHHLNQAQGELP